MHQNLFIHSPTEVHLGCSQILEIMGKAAINIHMRVSLLAQLEKNMPTMQETLVWFLGWEDHWRRDSLPTPVFLPGEFHGLYIVHGVAGNQTRLSNFHIQTFIYRFLCGHKFFIHLSIYEEFCISFLGLLKQSTTNWVPTNNRNLPHF